MRRSQRILKLVAAVLLLAAPASVSAQETGAKATLHLVNAGVSHYPNLNFRDQLSFADKDALDMASLWQQQGKSHFGQVSARKLINAQATRQQILLALDTVVRDAKAGDWVVVSLAGHGRVLPGANGGWHFLPHDVHPDNVAATSISSRDLLSRLQPLTQRGVTVILILDCCHCGAIADEAKSIVVLASCKSNELSSEEGDLQNGTFTSVVLQGLAGAADADGDGVVTLSELARYTAQQMQPCRLRQNPVFSGPNGGGLTLTRAVTP